MAGSTSWSDVRAEPCHGRGLSRHDLVFGGAIEARDHDAAMRIGGDAPGQRDHSVERRKPGTSLGTPPPRIVIGCSPISGTNTDAVCLSPLHLAYGDATDQAAEIRR